MSIGETIKKLQSIDVKDLRNIDLSRLRDLLKQSPIILINVALVGGTIFLVITLFSKSKLDEKKLTETATAYIEKLKALNEQKESTDEYDQFKNNFPKPIGGNQLIDKFSELAENRGVQILSFSPAAREKTDPHLNLETVNLSIESTDYRNIILFVKDIEELTYAVRVERFVARLGDSSRYRFEVQDESRIRADVEVISLRIK